MSANAHSLHRNEDVFPSPEEWRPERWLQASESELKEMRKWFWAFGSGGRMCIGSHFAVYSVKNAVAAVYTGFESVLVDEDGLREGMVQDEGYMAGPKAQEVMIKFWRVV